MINYVVQLFTFVRVLIAQRESSETPGQWDLVSVDMRFNAWKLFMLLTFCATMASTLSLFAVYYLVMLASMQ